MVSSTAFGFIEEQVWNQSLVLKIISCVTLKRPLALSEFHFTHLKMRIPLPRWIR